MSKATWTGSASGRWGFVFVLAVAVFSLGLAAASEEDLSPRVLITVAAVVVGGGVVFERIRVNVDADRVVARLGILGWPRKVIPLSDVTGVEIVRVNTLTSGLGLRRIRGAWALIVRGGDAIRLHRRDRIDFVISVDDAQGAAAAIERSLPTR